MIALNVPYDEPRRTEPRKGVVLDLCRRIWALAGDHPEILKLSSPALMSFPEFEFLDINPTLAEFVLACEMAPKIWETVQKNLKEP